MEFNEKLQELRKQRGITQEALAESIFVSRTAVSKWESGRGYPNIDSLKAIARFFGITVDELLSSNELLTIAESDQKKAESHARDLAFGLLDCCMAMFFFLPLFRQTAGVSVQAVSLLHLTEAVSYLRISYFVLVVGMLLSGILTLALQNVQARLWIKIKHGISLALGATGVLWFAVSMQPYATVFAFVFLLMKIFSLVKGK